MINSRPRHKLDYDPVNIMILAGTVLTFVLSIPLLAGG